MIIWSTPALLPTSGLRCSTGATRLTREQITALHERAHSECFTANSVTTELTVEAA